MNELLEKMKELSIEELQAVIARAQQLIQQKRLDAERQKEIAQLQLRLQELQAAMGSNVPQPSEDAAPAAAPAAAPTVTPLVPIDPPAAPQPAPQPAPQAAPQPATRPCPHCQQPVPLDSRFCFFCGQDVTQPPAVYAPRPAPKPRVCPECHAQVPAGSRFCQECGHVM